MAAQKGRNILVQVSDGVSPNTYTTIGGMRSKSITVNNATVDITTSDEAPWRKLLGDTGIRSVSLSGSGVFEDDAAVNMIEDMAFDGTIQEFRIVFGNGDYMVGMFQVTSFAYAGEHAAEQTFNASFESADQIQFHRA